MQLTITQAAAAQRRTREMYAVKVRNLHPAKRNPYRPQQRIKRTPWRLHCKCADWAEAKQICERMNGGFREAAIFVAGKLFCTPNQYTGKLPDTSPQDAK